MLVFFVGIKLPDRSFISLELAPNIEQISFLTSCRLNIEPLILLTAACDLNLQ